MKKLSFIGSTVVFTLFLFFVSSQDSYAAKCEEGSIASGNLQAQTLKTGTGCTMILSSIDESPAHRYYVFSQRGAIQIFNHYANNANASRTYFVFPRSGIPTASILNPSGEIEVTTSAGDRVNISEGERKTPAHQAVTPHILDNTSAPFQMIEQGPVSPTNKGGVNIQLLSSSKTLVLDTGFAMGGAAFTNPALSSVFTDAQGNHCTLSNKNLFSFTSGGDANLKFTTDGALYAYLKTACPNLAVPHAAIPGFGTQSEGRSSDSGTAQ